MATEYRYCRPGNLVLEGLSVKERTPNHATAVDTKYITERQKLSVVERVVVQCSAESCLPFLHSIRGGALGGLVPRNSFSLRKFDYHMEHSLNVNQGEDNVTHR